MAPVNCHNCGQASQQEGYPLINVAQDPSLKARVLDGSLFVWECPYCGARNLLKYPVLYHDPEARLMVWLLPGEENPSREVEAALKELEGYTFRRVKEVGELIEKVKIREAGLEDTVMEMCKWVTRQELGAKNPDMASAALKFVRTEGADNDLILAFPLNGQMQVVTVGFNVYEDARGILSRNPSIDPGPGFALVDAAWLDQYFR